jgi:hypothetical protein
MVGVRDTLCGRLIRAGSSDTTLRTCTFEGMIEVKDDTGKSTLLGVTTAHGIFPIEKDIAAEAVSSSDSDSDPEEDSSNRVGEDELDNNHPNYSHSPCENISMATSHAAVHLDDRIGKILHYSARADWALFEVKEEFCRPNFGKDQHQLTKAVDVEGINRGCTRRAVIYGEISGTVQGKISSTAFLVLPGSEELVEVFDLELAGDERKLSLSCSSYRNCSLTRKQQACRLATLGHGLWIQIPTTFTGMLPTWTFSETHLSSRCRLSSRTFNAN